MKDEIKDMNIKEILFVLVAGISLGIFIVFGVVQVTPINTPEPVNESINSSLNNAKGIIINDNDLDGLNNSFEKKIGTDPNKKDTDTDGYNDSYEYKQNKLNPMRKDIRLEIDYQKGTRVRDFQKLQDKFRNAPVKNPDGSKGINLHIKNDKKDLKLNNSYKLKTHAKDYEKYYDYEKKGYYHLIVVERPKFFGSYTNGFRMKGLNSFVIRDSYKSEHMLMEYIGYSINIQDSDYSGVNSKKKSVDKYNSILNENYNKNDLKFSTKKDSEFSDWEYIGNNLRNNNPKINPSDPYLKFTEEKEGILI